MRTAAHIIETVGKLVKKYDTRDPYELCKCLEIKIDDLRKLFYTNDGFFVCPCVQKFEPSEFEPCKNCNINYFCWSCVYPMYKIDEKEFKERCAYKKEILKNIWK